MAEAVRVYTRYDLPDKKGITRRERNEIVGVDSPFLEVPEDGQYLWEWFTDINNSVHRVDFNGYYCSIPPSEFLAWSKLTGNLIRSYEYDVLRAMDNAFCRELNNDITAERAKEDDRRKRELESSKSKARRR